MKTKDCNFCGQKDGFSHGTSNCVRYTKSLLKDLRDVAEELFRSLPMQIDNNMVSKDPARLLRAAHAVRAEIRRYDGEK